MPAHNAQTLVESVSLLLSVMMAYWRRLGPWHGGRLTCWWLLWATGT